MAKKVFDPLEDPPTASSSGDDEVETSSGEENEEEISNSSSNEEDDTKDPSITKTLKTPPAAVPSSGSETDSDSEEPEKTISVVTTKPKKNEGNKSTAEKPVKKRASEAAATTSHVKKAKNVSGDDEKKRFQRLWSEEDETSLLQGMIDFKSQKGISPYDDMSGFFDVAKKNISFDVSKIQFGDKIRSLKKKYFGKQKKKGLESSHDKKCLGLAKCIWGSDGMALKSPVKSDKDVLGSDVAVKSSVMSEKDVLGSDVKANGKFKKVKEEKEVVILGGDSESSDLFEKSFLVRAIASLGVDEFSLKRKWSEVPLETKKRIEEKVKLVEDQECELLLLKCGILKEVASVMTEGI